MQNINSIKLSELYASYFQKSYLFAMSYVHNQQAAEDIASDSIIKLFESIKDKKVENVQAFLLTILKNSSLDYLRKQAVKDRTHNIVLNNQMRELDFRISTLEECNPTFLFSKEIQQIIDESLATVSTKSKRIFEMSRYEHLSNKDIADKLNLSVKSIEYHITKVLALLRYNLRDYFLIFLLLLYFL